MKQFITLILAVFILTFSTVSGQTDKVKGNIYTIDTAELTILNIYPELFPTVSVLFKAESEKGEPVWNLTKEKMRVTENSQNCKVISLEQISKNKSLNLGVVIDHSGSMQGNIIQFDDKKNNSPIDDAKSAVKKFISSFNSKKDFISIIGFSSTVDKEVPLTQDINKINSIVNEMKADSLTALYDAMLAGISQIGKAEGIKVLVVLTDGWDNSSRSKWKDVVTEATKENIPIYIIGLGDVNTDTLQLLAKSTKGQSYFTQSSNSLSDIYSLISKQVQSFYTLVYSSSNFSSLDSTRQVELSFDIDSIYLLSNPATVNFPPEVIVYIEKKEKQKEYFLYGGIAVSVLILTGALLFYFRRNRKSNKPVIKKIYPNPTKGNINLDFESKAGQLKIITLSGQLVKTINIFGGETQFDFSDIKDGSYIAIIQSGGYQSNAVEFIIQR